MHMNPKKGTAMGPMTKEFGDLSKEADARVKDQTSVMQTPD